MHDDVGTILSSLAMESEMVNFADEKSRPQILNRISELARNAMSQMRDVVWVIDARKDKVEELADRMSDHLFDLFRYQEKSYSFEKSLRSGKTKLPPDVRQNFFLVFKEAVANFLKHSNGDQVEVSLVQSTEHLKLEVKDNGDVKKEKVQSSGLGLMNMKLRALNLGAKLNIEIENGFSITLLY